MFSDFTSAPSRVVLRGRRPDRLIVIPKKSDLIDADRTDKTDEDLQYLNEDL